MINCLQFTTLIISGDKELLRKFFELRRFLFYVIDWEVT